MVLFSHIKGLRISLASPDQIRSWSRGEVTKAETINYRTLKPEPGGLFCERIFGPVKNWSCSCGKYKKMAYKGKTCEKCGVQVAPARVRRSRMGHIELAAPVTHIWYTQGTPNRMSLLLGLAPQDLSDILLFNRYIVLQVDEEARRETIQRIKAELASLDTTKSSRLQPIEVVGTTNGNGHTQKNGVGKSSSKSTSSVLVQAAPDAKKTLSALAPLDLWDDDDPDEQELLDAAVRKRELRQVLSDLMMLTRLSLLEPERYEVLRIECGQTFRMGTGAAAVSDMLAMMDLEKLARSLRRQMHEQEGTQRTKTIKRLKVVEAFRRSGTNPQGMILHAVPVLPPDLRPVLLMEGGRFASTDINELYGRVIHRNERLKRLMRMDVPELMLNQEKRALQTACDCLLDNQRSQSPMLGARRRPLRSLTDSLRGKRGRFRHHLLGKRVDYSGRSVICPGTDLKLYQCGLPKKIALELFKPFIISKLLAYDIVQTPRQAKRAVERKDDAVFDVLDEVMGSRVVLLNRAPTLHRLSIQAFEPVLVEGNAIRLHPQVCSSFNADFDGDQMAVHLPLSREAQDEAYELMLSTHNLLSPASGEPAISISQDMVLGCFYLTQMRPGKKGEGRVFADSHEAVLAYERGVIDLQAAIQVRIQQETIFEQPLPAPPLLHSKGKRITTTVGRMIFNLALPKHLRFKNHAFTKDTLKQLMWECLKSYGIERTAVLADEIKRLGFGYATKAGISFAMSDVVVPANKKEILAEADNQVNTLHEEWRAGLITSDERYQQTIAIWGEATDTIAQMVQGALDPFGSVATIASSGATKAKLQQIRQLSGMRGLMASPSGAVIETPVRGNFLEGLSSAEYFLSSHGARKSLMDRSLNTAEAGYLTIRFVNAAQDVIITEENCGTTEGLLITAADSLSIGFADNRSRLLGRTLASSLPTLGLMAGEELSEEKVENIMAAGITRVRVRSVFNCTARRGVCQKCYGWDLSTRALVRIGTAVGIIAAQSIGEPGTQLTMRTFHSGGIAGGQGDITQGIPRVEELFEARIPKEQAIISESEGIVEVSRDETSGGYTVRILPEGSAQGTAATYSIPRGRQLAIGDGQQIEAGDPITVGPLNPQEVLRLRGREMTARYLLKEAQRVYRTTGAYIHDKHFEVLIRQMLRYVQIEHPGDTSLLPDELIDRLACIDINARILAQGGDPARGRPALLGLTRATLATESWLSAASFQQTDRILADAAIEGRIDHLIGLKENVILGKLIPAGTGLHPRPPRRSPTRKIPARRGRPPGSKNKPK